MNGLEPLPRHEPLDRPGRAAEPDDGGSTLVGVLGTLLVLGALLAVLARLGGGPTAETVQRSSGESGRAACEADGRLIEVAVEAFKAQTGVYPRALAELEGRFLRSLPKRARYTIGLGAKADPGATGPAAGTAGTPAEWPAGTVLVAPGPPPVAVAGYRAFRDSERPPCDDPAIRS